MTSNPVDINTTLENAEEALTLTNKFLADAGAKDEKGNPLVFKQLAGSPMWLMFLARGQQATEWQERANKVYNALDIANCEEEQVLNLALLSGVRQKQRTSTFCSVYITNNEDSTIVINSRNSKFADSVYNYEWYIGQNITLATHVGAKVQLYCATTNDVSLPVGTTFTATPLIEGTWGSFSCQSVSDTVNGTRQETMAELRNRIMVGTSAYSMVNQAQDAIARLAGISKCTIYFNQSAINSMPLPGGITVPIRSCLVVIRGADANDLIAKTYFEYMDVQTYRPLGRDDVLTSYERIGALDMPVHYLQATLKKVYLRITVDTKRSDPNYASYCRKVLESYNGTTDVGQNITSKLASVWLNDMADYINVIGVEVSDDNETWSNTSNIDCFTIADIDLDNITYVEG